MDGSMSNIESMENQGNPKRAKFNDNETVDAANTRSSENDLINSSLESTSSKNSNAEHVANMDDPIHKNKLDVENEEPQMCENAGPSTPRLSHTSRNYRRRVDDSSSDEDFQFRIVRNSSTEQSEASTIECPTMSQVARAVEEIGEVSDTNSHNDDSSDSVASQSALSSSSDWTVEDTYSSADSTDRFGFEPNEEIDGIVDSILQKQKPKYAWRSVPSIMYRQNGFIHGDRLSHSATTPYNFQAKVRGSLHVVERLELMGKLSGHYGCINCLNFNQNGKYLASGSDDLRIKIWNWATKKVHITLHTKHTSNIFQAKFVDYNGYEGCFELVSSDQSGSVRHYAIKPCGSVQSEKILSTSSRAVHKLGLPSNRPYEVLSAGEDSRVMLMDLREKTAIKLLKTECPLYSIACHPLDSNEFCVGGQDQFVRVYDRRSLKSTLRIHCPPHLQHRQVQLRSVTSAVYNYVGTEILATYSNENIYLFDCANNQPGGFLHKYCGHRNNRTIKGVNFYGPRSEFIVSGSENPGHVFFWEKESEAIVQLVVGDIGGVVNCIEPHPFVPVLATSGLSEEIRLWHPSKDEDPDFFLLDLKKYVNRNMNVQLARNADRNSGMDFIQFILQRMRQRAEDFENRDDDASQSLQNDTSDEDEDVGDNSMDTYELNPCNTS